jgi:hypothetical protein
MRKASMTMSWLAGERRQQAEMGQRIDGAEAENGAGQQDLHGDGPAAPLAERQGRAEAVEQGGPDPFEIVGKLGQQEQADIGALDAGLGQARRQGGIDQQQRQAAGKAEQQHGQLAGIAIDGKAAAAFSHNRNRGCGPSPPRP